MGKVIFDISMSLDGFITAANARPAAGLGDDGERLHDWGFNSTDPSNHAIMEWFTHAGANIFGRIGYYHSIIQRGSRWAIRCGPHPNGHRFAQRTPEYSRWRGLYFR
jgi:hypothetical protein